MPDTFCRFLQNGLVYNNDTTHFTVSPCCYFSKEYKVLPGQPIDRSQWLKEDLAVTCHRCISIEQAGQTSYRQSSFDEITGTTDQVEFLTVAVNKKCNLACASCDSRSSSFWYQEDIRNNIKPTIEIQSLHQEDRAGAITEQFIEQLANLDLSDIKYIKFGGGEPLMSDTHERIMSLIPNPSQVTLQYTSNFSIMPTRRVMDQWSRFQLVKWVASIDGVKDQFEFLRWPYKWDKLNEFTAKAIATVPGNVMIGVEHTLNPLNIYYFDQFQQWFEQNLMKNAYGDRSDFNLHTCYGVMDLANTPAALREVIYKKYGDNNPITLILKKQGYTESTNSMVDYLNKLDQIRNLDWRETFLEVEAYFE